MIKQENPLLKILPHVVAIIIFAAITMIYFSPLFEGKMVHQSDVSQYEGSAKEIKNYYQQEGESSTWTGSMFSGMPSYQIAVFGGSPNFLSYLEAPVKKIFDPTSSAPVFMGMLMAYILFCVLGVRPTTAALGAIAYALSSYNIIIIDAGHVTKAWAIAYMPLIIAGMLVLFKKKYLLGGILFALGLALQIKSNHLQITYYTALFAVIIYVGLIINQIVKKDIKGLFKASGVLAGGLVIALLCNTASIYANYEMGMESTRGKSELTAVTKSVEKETTGLDKEYVFAWSYGKAETFSFLIPDIHGGSSGGMLDRSSNLAQEIIKKGFGDQVGPQGIEASTYWGDQPFTSGPVYFGAIICLLFVLGMIVIRSNLKWVLFAATVFFIFLAWGRNMEWFNDLFYYHFPLYNKFRTVSTALVIPALTMIIIAIWGLIEFFAEGVDPKKRTKSLYIAIGVVGGFALLFLVGSGAFFDFVSASDAQWKSQVPVWYYNALLLDRQALLTADALRSLALVLSAGAVLWASVNLKQESRKIVSLVLLILAIGISLYMFSGSIKAPSVLLMGIILVAILGLGTLFQKRKVENFMIPIASVILVMLTLADLWSVDKRYLDDSKFVPRKEVFFQQTEADKAILKDKDPSYRVLKLGDPFADAVTSYYHKSVGGYHAAKLKRYQELIENRLQSEVAFIQNRASPQLEAQIKYWTEVQQQGVQVTGAEIPQAMQDSVAPFFRATSMLNALNARYVIYHPQLPPLVNPFALGNAWFVSEYKFVENADAEIASIENLNPATTAVVDKRFQQNLEGLTISKDSAARIELIEYKPNRLTYRTKTASEQLAVMSEIYYANGWQAYIDGTPVPHFRADWTLRAMRVPAGEHEIEFRFEPATYNTTRTIATASSGLLMLLLLGGIGMLFFKKDKKEEEA